MTELAGRLLVAGPTLLDPNFARSVVLVCEHGADGALGVVLNRPSETPVGDVLPQWSPFIVDPPVVFVGGPVQPEVGVGLAEVADPEPGWSPVIGDTGLFDLGSEVPAPGAMRRLRVYSGYAGWSTGQLEDEVAQGDWWVEEALPDDPFAPDAGGLWASVLRRRPDPMYTHFPVDPSLN